MATIKKHVGKYGEKRCVVVFRELPDDTENALVVMSDSLEGQFHDDVMSVVDSVEGQESNNISEVLFRRRLSDGENILEALHTRKKLIRVPVEMVKLTPYPNQEIALSEVNAEIRKIETGSNPPLKTEVDPATLESPAVQPQQSTTDSTSDPKDIAQSLLAQAALLEEDAKGLISEADVKRAEAYRLDPESAPKRGPGRPSKTKLEDVTDA